MKRRADDCTMGACGSVVAAATLAAVTALPLPALAWGSEGHHIVAALAYERLTPKARQAVDDLITASALQDTPSCPVHSIEDVSMWPDCVRPLPRFQYLAVRHYEDVPICGIAPKASYCPDGQCVTDEIRKAIAILKDRERSKAERLQALEEVVHFIGDLHQPLHAADNHDRGGSEDGVEVGNYHTHLHHVWDTEIVVAAVGSSETAAEAELRPLVQANAASWSKGDVDQWLGEAHRIAVRYVYPRLTTPPACGALAQDQAITTSYLDDAAPIVRVQLARAAVRLARVLNGAPG